MTRCTVKLFFRIGVLAVGALLSGLTTAHKIGSETSGAETPSVPSVESCASFQWTEKRRCSRYDSISHYWEVKNNCPRDVRVSWADNAFNQPIERGEDGGKPKIEKADTVRPGKTEGSDVGCVDKAELEICIEYVYPPLKEHDVSVRCDDFFD